MEDAAGSNFSVLILATQYMFYVCYAGMFAASIFFLMERNNLTPKYSIVASLCMMVTCIAGVNYHYMKGVVGLDGLYTTLSAFPTQFRYADWILTTPIILSSIVMLTNSPKKGGILTKLILADVFMVVTGYIGEVSINHAGGGTTLGWAMFLASCAAFVYLLFVPYGQLAEAAADMPDSMRKHFSLLQNYILCVWMVYPIGYMAPLLGYKGELLAVRELAYCIADLTAKAGFGILVVSLAKKLSLHEMEQVEDQAA